jgi:hypothetical protein
LAPRADVFAETPEPPFLRIKGSQVIAGEGDLTVLTVAEEESVGDMELPEPTGALDIRIPGVGMVSFRQATVGGFDILDAGPLLQPKEPAGSVDLDEGEALSAHELS